MDALCDLKRQARSVVEHFTLLDVNIQVDNRIECKILGSTNKDYRLVFTWDVSELYYKCTCNDHTYRKVICKHLYWFGESFLARKQPTFWTMYDLTQFIRDYLYFQNLMVGLNDICPICFNCIDYASENTVCCVSSCQNSVHAECWKRYTHITPTSKCVICRRQSMPHLEEF